MKKTLSGFLFIFLFVSAVAQKRQQDSLAIRLIDRISDIIGDLESCSADIQFSKDVEDSSHLESFNNGIQLPYYFRDENNYGIIPAPSTMIAMIDSFNAIYHIDFPAADFLYPSFTDDHLNSNNIVKFPGRSQINVQDCFLILASNKDMNTQIRISSNEYNLPLKYVFTYKNKPGYPQFEDTFSN